MVRLESNIYNKTDGGDIILGATIIIFNSENNEVERISIVDEVELNNLKSQLDVLDETYVRFVNQSSLQGRSIDSLLSNQSNDVVINATKFAGITSEGYSKSDHIHDDRYFTKSEVTSKLAGKSNTNHLHANWGSMSVGSYGTLYYNNDIRIAQFRYYNPSLSHGGSSVTLNTTIPNGYRTVNGISTSTHNGCGVLIGGDGSIKVYGLPSSSPTLISFGTMWHY